MKNDRSWNGFIKAGFDFWQGKWIYQHELPHQKFHGLPEHNYLAKFVTQKNIK